MSKYLLRKRQIQCHQENRPVYRMETDDILSNQMQVSRPVLLEQIIGAVRIITDLGSFVLIRPSDKDKCEEVLEKNGVAMVSQDEVDKF